VDLDLTLLQTVLSVGSLQLLIKAGLSSNDIEGPMNPIFTYLFDRWKNPRNAQTLPSPELIKRKFPVFQPGRKRSRESLDALIAEIKKRSVYNFQKDHLERLASHLKKNDTERASKELHRASALLSALHSSGTTIDLTQNTEERKQNYVMRREKKDTSPTPTGFDWMDGVLSGGWSPGDLILLIGKSGTGKTWWALITSIAAQMAGHRVLFVSREMDTEKVKIRYDSLLAKLSFGKFRKGEIGKRAEKHYYQKLEDLKKAKGFFLHDQDFSTSSRCSPSYLHARARELKCSFICIDCACPLG
jgi:replicative DNA helicase